MLRLLALLLFLAVGPVQADGYWRSTGAAVGSAVIGGTDTRVLYGCGSPVLLCNSANLTYSDANGLFVGGNFSFSTNGTAILVSSNKAASTDGNNIFIGGGGQSVAYDGTNAYSGSFNTANGYQSMFLNTTGSSNTANGVNALFSNTIGSCNTANGSAMPSSPTLPAPATPPME